MRTRKEIRNLTVKEWKALVDAFWVLRRTSTSEGQDIYGSTYISYEDLTERHMQAALNIAGDLAHFNPFFPLWHRLWLLELEDSLISVDSSIQGLAYWFSCRNRMDYREQKSGKSIFNKEYLGNSTGREGDFVVVDGKFKFWPVKYIDKGSPSKSSQFRFQRSPLSVNKAPYVTRNGGSMCGLHIGLASVEYFENCINKGPNIAQWLKCVDPTIHGRVHSVVGGSFRRSSQTSDSTDCTQWYGYIAPPAFPPGVSKPDNFVPGSFIHPISAGCFTCKKCELSQSSDSCLCKPKDGLCGPLWSGFPDEDWAKVTLVSPEHIQILGDFTDPISSCTDPLFPFHHANVDRNFDKWLKVNVLEGNRSFYKYPTSGYAFGSNLNDVIGPDDVFYTVLSRHFPNHHIFTAKTILKLSFNQKFPYTYNDDNFGENIRESTFSASVGQASSMPLLLLLLLLLFLLVIS